ncbi:MAG: DUF5947 family protein [Gaiellaceae bacterium]
MPDGVAADVTAADVTGSPRLARLAGSASSAGAASNSLLQASEVRVAGRQAAEQPQAQVERCELCGEAIAPEHRHVVDLHVRSLLCACRGCAILLDRPGAGGGHYRLVPERRLWLDGFDLDDLRWASLGVPVDLAFFFRSSGVGRTAAVYPGAMGATESLLELETWQELEDANPVLRGLEDDVEALLVNHADGRHDHFLVPIDDCYALAGVMRTHWKGFGGGAEVWREIDAFFDRLRERAHQEGS